VNPACFITTKYEPEGIALPFVSIPFQINEWVPEEK
ncbi:uncharacterized protein METZ01_LOCUS349483, partial [marine metagenome]